MEQDLLHLQSLDLGSDLLIYELYLPAGLANSLARQKLQCASPLPRFLGNEYTARIP